MDKAWERYQGRTLYDANGDRVGAIDEVYVDPVTRQPQWGLVHTGFLGTRSSFVPLAQATFGKHELHVPHTQEQIKQAPNLDAGGELSHAEEQRLWDHYQLAEGHRPSELQRLRGQRWSEADAARETTGAESPVTEPLAVQSGHRAAHEATRGDLAASMTTSAGAPVVTPAGLDAYSVPPPPPAGDRAPHVAGGGSAAGPDERDLDGLATAARRGPDERDLDGLSTAARRGPDERDLDGLQEQGMAPEPGRNPAGERRDR